MNKPKAIYCPQCGEKVGNYDGRSTINFIARCNKCRKRIIYYIDSGETAIKPLLKRSCSSGMMYC